MKTAAQLQFHTDSSTLQLAGIWRAGQLSAIEHLINNFKEKAEVIDASEILSMDTAGAYLLHQLRLKFKKNINIKGLKDSFHELLDIVSNDIKILTEKPIEPPRQN